MKKTPGKTVEERAQYWAKMVRDARRYPFGITAFCRHKGINKNNYYKWFQKLRAQHPNWSNQAMNPKGKAVETEVIEKAKRRRFTADEKARILKECDAASTGDVASVLRREGIYSSQLQKWRAEKAANALSGKKRGPQPKSAAAEVRKLKADLQRAEKNLERANEIIILQKKVSMLLGVHLEESQEPQ